VSFSFSVTVTVTVNQTVSLSYQVLCIFRSLLPTLDPYRSISMQTFGADVEMFDIYVWLSPKVNNTGLTTSAYTTIAGVDNKDVLQLNTVNPKGQLALNEPNEHVILQFRCTDNGTATITYVARCCIPFLFIGLIYVYCLLTMSSLFYVLCYLLLFVCVVCRVSCVVCLCVCVFCLRFLFLPLSVSLV
jgi:hypothetical protein